jgi:hypothetical protein
MELDTLNVGVKCSSKEIEKIDDIEKGTCGCSR